MVTSINGSTPTVDPNYSISPAQDSIAAEFGGDAAAQLAAMVFLFSRERSRDASENRNTLENAIQARQAEQVELMHDAADSRFAGAVISGFTQVVGGLVSSSGKSSDKAMGAAVDGTGKMFAAGFTKLADDQSADALAQGNQAGTGIRALEQVEQNATEAQDTRKRTLEFMSAIQETKAEADKALVSIRA